MKQVTTEVSRKAEIRLNEIYALVYLELIIKVEIYRTPILPVVS
jgi:hypothetical protein